MSAKRGDYTCRSAPPAQPRCWTPSWRSHGVLA